MSRAFRGRQASEIAAPKRPPALIGGVHAQGLAYLSAGRTVKVYLGLF